MEDNFLITAEGRREALAVPGRDRAGHDARQSRVWAGELNRAGARAAAARHGRLYDTTLRDGEQTVGVVLIAGGQGRDCQSARRGRDRPDRGRVPARLRGGPARGIRLIISGGSEAEVWGFARAVPADVEALADLGVRGVRHREPDLGREAGGARRLARDDARTDPKGRAFAAGHGITRRVLRRRLDPRPTSRSSVRAYERRSRRARRRSSSSTRSASPRRKPRRSSSARSRLARRDVPVHLHGHDDFGLATAPRSPPCRPARPGYKAP